MFVLVLLLHDPIHKLILKLPVVIVEFEAPELFCSEEDHVQIQPCYEEQSYWLSRFVHEHI